MRLEFQLIAGHGKHADNYGRERAVCTCLPFRFKFPAVPFGVLSPDLDLLICRTRRDYQTADNIDSLAFNPLPVNIVCRQAHSALHRSRKRHLRSKQKICIRVWVANDVLHVLG